MRPLVGFIVAAVLAIVFSVVLSMPLGPAPALGPLLSPTQGFWANAEPTNKPIGWNDGALAGLQAEVNVVYDQRHIPHIYAQNDHDLYYMQGYLTAAYRLWQLDFQTRAAEGRLAEIIGPRALPLDERMVRLGMRYAAEKAYAEMQKDEQAMAIAQAYSDGINAYLEQLAPQDYPIEYKLLGYAPEPWTPKRSVYLLKYMSLTLSGYSSELQMSRVLNYLTPEEVEDLYPIYPRWMDPIIPPGTEWPAEPVEVPPVPEQHTIKLGEEGPIVPMPDKDNGSNNWVVDSSRSATGWPILANDPHLSLTLPAIWFEMHLTSPEQSVYGAALAGAPGIIIGFNQNVAWGVTNVGSDVLDHYAITFKDDTYQEYRYEGAWRETTMRVEEIKVKGQASILDTVIYTHHGPMRYLNDSDEDNNELSNLAMRWIAYEPGNEMMTFISLNKAKNYDDYAEALKVYSSPAQNFLFADNSQNIALWVNGKFPLKWSQQGKFVLDGSRADHDWQGWIPQDHNPHAVNPERGFLSSANQQSTDPTYPYYLDWDNEEYERGMRINDRLSQMYNATADSLRELQNDNYNLLADSTLPTILAYLDSTAVALDEEATIAREILAGWNRENGPDEVGATLYDAWWDIFTRYTWEDNLPAGQGLMWPARDQLGWMVVNQPAAKWFDVDSTDAKESLGDILASSLNETMRRLRENPDYGSIGTADAPNEAYKWGYYQGTRIPHMTRLLKGFESDLVWIGGGAGIVNATKGTSGPSPSWRMVVALGAEGPQGFAVYPGGQSGNPGSVYYSNFIDTWGNGELYPLHYGSAPESVPAEQVLGRHTFTPAAN